VALIVVVLLLLAAASAQKPPAAPLTTSVFTGTWEANRFKGPWIINLQASGPTVTGKLWQDGGFTGPVPIFDGRIDGNTVSFRYAIPRPSGGGPVIALTGTLQKDEVTFRSEKETASRGGGEGLLSVNVPAKFSVKRADAAVWGTTTVSNGLPLPAVRFALVDSKGKRFDPVKKNVEGPNPTVPGTLRAFMVRLPVGEYRPVISGGLPNGYKIRTIDANGVSLNSNPLRILPDSPAPELAITIDVTSGPPWVTVQGRVKNAADRLQRSTSPFRSPTSTPFPATSVQLTNDAFSEAWVAPLDNSGSFQFQQILPGTYQVRFMPDFRAVKAMTLIIRQQGSPIQFDLVAPDVDLGCATC
jgi:hypothetical protein